MTPEQAERARIYQAAYRAENAERLRAYRHQPDVKARRNETTQTWRSANQEAVRVADRAAYKANPDRKRKATVAYRRANPDSVKQALAAWVKANPERRAEYNRNAKARRKMASGSHTNHDIHALHKLQRGCCGVCRIKLTDFHVDHVTPLSKGGTNDRLNLQLLCPGCNLRKGAKDPIDFMQEKGFLL